MPDFIIYAWLTGFALAMVAGPLGSLMVWRRMAYLGDTLSHSALLGIALGLLLQINLTLTVLVGCVFLGVVLILLEQKGQMAIDTLLGILAHSTLSLGLVVLSFMPWIRFDVTAFLWGDLLAIESSDLLIIIGGCVVILLLVTFYWKALVSITINAELASVEGLPVQRLHYLLVILLASVIAIAMKLVGVLLITALLIIPAATAQRLARSPGQTASLASLLGLVAVTIGLMLSWYGNTPAGPSIVVASAFIFLVCLILQKK